MKITEISIWHMIRALQLKGFGHEEIMALKAAMETNNFKKIKFINDIKEENNQQ